MYHDKPYVSHFLNLILCISSKDCATQDAEISDMLIQPLAQHRVRLYNLKLFIILVKMMKGKSSEPDVRSTDLSKNSKKIRNLFLLLNSRYVHLEFD